MKTLLLKNVQEILPNQKFENASVLIEGETVVGFFSDNKTVNANEEIDLSNITLFAGFIDIHIHGAVRLIFALIKVDVSR
jgi:N-acetylglucosamine-6-phosphate deacetylase